MKNAEKNLIERKAVGLRFFIGMICNTDSTKAYSFNNIIDLHNRTPL